MVANLDEAPRSATIYPIHPCGRSSVQAELHLALRIDNHQQIAAAYGRVAAEAAVAEVQRVLDGLLRGSGLIVHNCDGVLNAVLWIDGALFESISPQEHATLIEALCAVVSTSPVRCGAERFHISLSAAAAVGSCPSGREHIDTEVMAAANAGLGRLTFGGAPAVATPCWQEAYRSDMARAVELFEALNAGRLHLAWQAIRKARQPDEILYHECLLRMIGAEGGVVMPGAIIPPLERLGLVRALDRHIAMKAIEELEANPSIHVAVNISAQSAACDHWWASAEAALRDDPALASRLVVEITETAALPSVAAAANFAAHMRRLHCRIALDDFGVGHASIQHLIALSPDIIKVDGLFVRRSAEMVQGPATLRHLIALANTLAETVIVEGVETEEQSCAIALIGGDWQQGYFLGRPAAIPPWRHAGRMANLVKRRAIFEHAPSISAREAR